MIERMITRSFGNRQQRRYSDLTKSSPTRVSLNGTTSIKDAITKSHPEPIPKPTQTPPLAPMPVLAHPPRLLKRLKGNGERTIIEEKLVP